MTFDGTWILDATHSEVGFTVRHAGISKVRGKFEEAQAGVVHEGDVAKVEATIAAESFTTHNSDRDAHIKGADFLNVEAFPVLTFSGVYSGDELRGELTIKGISRPVVFAVEEGGQAVDPFGNTRAGFDAVATIDRRDFGLTWNTILDSGGVLVSDKIKLELALSFIKTD